MKIETIILILAIISTGIMTGVFFTWSNAVTPGIGKLGDMEYLSSLQSMNRAILNTPFRIIFMAAVICVALVFAIHFKSYGSPIFWILLTAFAIYWIGAFGVTFFGNIPLNQILEKTELETISAMDAKSLRISIENKWNSLNWIRTYSSLSSFILLLISYLTINN
ncbi:MAG: DUF1772 domain-containing protein [Maribacter sp.]